MTGSDSSSPNAAGPHLDGPQHQDPSQAWSDLAPDYERARAREDSLDRLVEWPGQRGLLGGVRGRSVLDLGCGNGGKLIELAEDGAIESVGVDISGNFLPSRPPGVELIRGDLSDPQSIRRFRGEPPRADLPAEFFGD